jgi:cytoplasmic iron level regulating protein YaaA (DUF328/UPF0246 family)
VLPDLAILLPPSETKLTGGDGPPLHLGALVFDDQLSAIRKQLVDAVLTLAADPPAARAALGLSARQDDQVALNAAIWDSPTAPAIRRYTGVLYDALGYGTLPAAARRRADSSLFVSSALFGLVAAGDPVPAYRLSAGSVLPGLPTLGALWRPSLQPVLGELAGLVLDLRSSQYAQLAPLPGAVTVRVLSEFPDGSRKVVSHFSKHHKGVLVRALLQSRASLSDLRGLLRAIRRAGMTAEQSGELRADVIVPTATTV